MSHLAVSEMVSCLDALFRCLMGDDIVSRWRKLKEKTSLSTEREFAGWVLNVAEKYCNSVATIGLHSRHGVDDDDGDDVSNLGMEGDHDGIKDNDDDDDYGFGSALKEASEQQQVVVEEGVAGSHLEYGCDVIFDTSHQGSGSLGDSDHITSVTVLPSGDVDDVDPTQYMLVTPLTSSTVPSTSHTSNLDEFSSVTASTAALPARCGTSSQASTRIVSVPVPHSPTSSFSDHEQVLEAALPDPSSTSASSTAAAGGKALRNTYSCHMCSASFRDRYSLKGHQGIVHGQGKVHKCHFCAQLFYSRADRIKHEATRHVLQRYACDICGKTFSQSRNILPHKRAVHFTERYPCSQCSAEYARQSHLNEHVKRVHERIRFRCNVCSLTFATRQNVHRHMFVKHDLGGGDYNK